MPPRRKKTAEGESSEMTPATGASGALSAPKKKATRTRKPAAKPAPSKELAKPPIPPLFPAPRLSPMVNVAPKAPVDIPIRPAPRMSIEPEMHANDDVWVPSRKNVTDLSTPPSVLLQSKKLPRHEVEDILEEPEGEDFDEVERDEIRPVVRTGFYRKIAVGFAVLALLVAMVVTYVVYAHATVTVYPAQAEVSTERVLTITEAASGADEIAGEIREVTVAGEKTGAPSQSVAGEGVAKGFVTLINETDRNQVLVEKTRLLTPAGILFRLKTQVNVPAHGQLKTEVYADVPGASGDIGPSTFTIPGLNAALQKTIYAKSDAAMTGGVTSVGTVSAGDIDKIETALRQELEAQAKEELLKKIEGTWTGTAYLSETMNRFVSAAPGETSNGITIRLTLRVRAAGFDREKALTAAAADLRRGLTSERELVDVDSAHATFVLEKADPKAGTGSLQVGLKGLSRVSMENPLFDAARLRGMDLEAVQAYFEGIEGVERVEVKFHPFWIKRMPDLEDHIEFKIIK